MKKMYVLLCLLMVGTCAAYAMGLWAGDEGAPMEALWIYVDLSETELAGPQTVEVTIKVRRNESDGDCAGPLTLYYPDGAQITEFGAPVLAAGEQVEWTGAWYVTQNQLDAGKVCFGVRYTGKNALGIPVTKEGYVAAGVISLTTEEDPTSPVLVLTGNPTTGYDWLWESDHEGVVMVSTAYVSDMYYDMPGIVPPVGGGGRYRVVLTGLCPGEATLTFSYKRAWEEESLYTLVYHIRVDDDLNVTILSSRFDW